MYSTRFEDGSPKVEKLMPLKREELTLWLIFIKVPTDETTRGWTSLMVAILFLGGIQLIALGAIGEYLGRAYLSVNQYPQFSINN